MHTCNRCEYTKGTMLCTENSVHIKPDLYLSLEWTLYVMMRKLYIWGKDTETTDSTKGVYFKQFFINENATYSITFPSKI